MLLETTYVPSARGLDPAAMEAEAIHAAGRAAGILPAGADDDDGDDGGDAPEPRENPPREERGPVEEEADDFLRGVPRTGRRGRRWHGRRVSFR